MNDIDKNMLVSSVIGFAVGGIVRNFFQRKNERKILKDIDQIRTDLYEEIITAQSNIITKLTAEKEKSSSEN